MGHDNRSSALTILIRTLGVAAVVGRPVLAEDVSTQVWGHYPTRVQLQLRVDETRASHPMAYDAAKRDFGEAIRVSRSLKGPPWPGKQSGATPIVRPKPKLYALKTRADWESDFRLTDELSPGSEWVEFYRAHLDELTIDYSSPLLRDVLIDVLLNGWHDWTSWGDGKLAKLRAKFPELHRVYAIRELRRLKVKDIGGVLLDLLRQPDIAPEMFFPEREGVKELVQPGDALAFVLDVYVTSNDNLIRTRMEHLIPSFSARVGKTEAVREIWGPYLESDIPLLRFEARLAFDLPVPDPFARHDIHERWVAENDPDPGRRAEARKHVDARALRQQIRERQAREQP